MLPSGSFGECLLYNSHSCPRDLSASSFLCNLFLLRMSLRGKCFNNCKPTPTHPCHNQPPLAAITTIKNKQLEQRYAHMALTTFLYFPFYRVRSQRRKKGIKKIATQIDHRKYINYCRMQKIKACDWLPQFVRCVC